MERGEVKGTIAIAHQWKYPINHYKNYNIDDHTEKKC